MIRNKNLRIILVIAGVLLIVFLLPYTGHAQPMPGDPPPPPCTNPDDPACPIDGGLSMLIVAGVGYGVRRFRGRKKLVGAMG